MSLLHFYHSLNVKTENKLNTVLLNCDIQYLNCNQHCFSKPILVTNPFSCCPSLVLISSSIEEVIVFLINVVSDLISCCRYSVLSCCRRTWFFAGAAANASVHVVAGALATASVSGVAQTLLLLLMSLPAADPPCWFCPGYYWHACCWCNSCIVCAVCAV
jgi:hypothetical protein